MTSEVKGSVVVHGVAQSFSPSPLSSAECLTEQDVLEKYQESERMVGGAEEADKLLDAMVDKIWAKVDLSRNSSQEKQE